MHSEWQSHYKLIHSLNYVGVMVKSEPLNSADCFKLMLLSKHFDISEKIYGKFMLLNLLLLYGLINKHIFQIFLILEHCIFLLLMLPWHLQITIRGSLSDSFWSDFVQSEVASLPDSSTHALCCSAIPTTTVCSFVDRAFLLCNSTAQRVEPSLSLSSQYYFSLALNNSLSLDWITAPPCNRDKLLAAF